MAQNFLPCDRDQQFLLPPSPREWLPEDHLAWFVIDAVEAFDLAPFYADYRADGHGRPAHDPQMMVALLLYAYATGTRSSCAIERRLREDVAFRVIAAGQAPDHATIARFRHRHEAALCGLFSDVLALCQKAGLVRSGTLALDSTKLHANASERANTTYDELAREILDEAAATDAAEDELYGERRGDELPDGLRTWRERRDWLRKAKRELEAEQAARPHPGRSREARLAEAERRLAEQHALERHALEAEQEATAKRLAEHRERGHKPTGRRRIHPLVVPAQPTGRINVTDPDSRLVKTERGFIQGYSAQAAATEDQIIVMADVTIGGPDQGRLGPLAVSTVSELERVGASPPKVLLADAGYWHGAQIADLRRQGIDALVAPDRQAGQGPPAYRQRSPLAAELRARLETNAGARPLSPAPANHRADLRSDEGEPRHRPLLMPRTRCLPGRMAPHHRDAQPPEALAPRPAGRGLRPGAGSRTVSSAIYAATCASYVGHAAVYATASVERVFSFSPLARASDVAGNERVTDRMCWPGPQRLHTKCRSVRGFSAQLELLTSCVPVRRSDRFMPFGRCDVLGAAAGSPPMTARLHRGIAHGILA
jgi:transposase